MKVGVKVKEGQKDEDGEEDGEGEDGKGNPPLHQRPSGSFLIPPTSTHCPIKDGRTGGRTKGRKEGEKEGKKEG